MASIAGRPYNVGFNFRVISAYSGITQDIWNVTEFNYNQATFALENTIEHLTDVPQKLGRGDFMEFTAGRNKDQFTVVYVNCQAQCEVNNATCIY